MDLHNHLSGWWLICGLTKESFCDYRSGVNAIQIYGHLKEKTSSTLLRPYMDNWTSIIQQHKLFILNIFTGWKSEIKEIGKIDRWHSLEGVNI